MIQEELVTIAECFEEFYGKYNSEITENDIPPQKEIDWVKIDMIRLECDFSITSPCKKRVYLFLVKGHSFASEINNQNLAGSCICLDRKAS